MLLMFPKVINIKIYLVQSMPVFVVGAGNNHCLSKVWRCTMMAWHSFRVDGLNGDME